MVTNVRIYIFSIRHTYKECDMIILDIHIHNISDLKLPEKFVINHQIKEFYHRINSLTKIIIPTITTF